MSLISWCFAALLALAVAGPWEPFPYCSECLPTEAHNAPGIGFDLTHSYGTAAAHLVNGSVVDLAKVAASADYTALLAHLVDAPAPPALTFGEKWRRFLNKMLGRPATLEVGILADMFLSLRDQSVAVLSPTFKPSFRLDAVVVTRPPLSGLRREDLADALEHAGLRSWLDPPKPGEGLKAGMYPEVLGEAQAAFAADGNGLCAHYRDLFVCENEEEHMPSSVVLVASFTRQALYVAAGVIRAPFHWMQYPLVNATDLNAGLDSMGGSPTPDKFWAGIGRHLRTVAQQALVSTDRGFTKLLLLGENATNPEFLKVLRDSVADLVESKSSEETVIGETALTDPVFAGARGAAQYARWRQESPFGCRERPQCENQRRKGVHDVWEGKGVADIYIVFRQYSLFFCRYFGFFC